jgi:hypothetical protein
MIDKLSMPKLGCRFRFRFRFEKVKDDLDVAQLGMQESSKMCLAFQEAIPTQFLSLKELLLKIALG